MDKEGCEHCRIQIQNLSKAHDTLRSEVDDIRAEQASQSVLLARYSEQLEQLKSGQLQNRNEAKESIIKVHERVNDTSELVTAMVSRLDDDMERGMSEIKKDIKDVANNVWRDDQYGLMALKEVTTRLTMSVNSVLWPARISAGAAITIIITQVIDGIL